MQTPNSTLSSSPLKPEKPNSNNTTPSSSTISRLWRPAAQRNLRNQWMKLVSHKQKWMSASSAARSHATSLVNAYLSQRYLPSMDLGALKDLSSIRDKSCQKLSSQQVSCLSEFKNLERLDLRFNNLTSLQGLSGCVNLKWLSVSQNKLQNLQGIENLTKLTQPELLKIKEEVSRINS